MKRSPMKPGTKGLARGKPMARSAKPMRSDGKQKAPLKTKQRAVSAAEKVLWSKLAALGCVACMKDGRYNPHVSIHHIDGRTKPGCHQLVLGLCAGHHQDGAGEDKTLLAVHPYKAQFEARYGPQMALLAECMALLAV